MAILPTSNDNKVDQPSAPYLAMRPKWDLIDDLNGGTLTMRDAGQRWLPMENGETMTMFEARLNRSYLYGAFKDTVQKLSAKPFSKPVATSGELPEQLQPMIDNVDFAGRDFTQFAKAVFEDGLRYGIGHILVDFPQTGGNLSRHQERTSGVRPYFIHINPADMLAWKKERQADGTERLTQIRFRERRTEYEEGFGEVVVDYIRVINEGDFELWRKPPKEQNFVRVDAGTHSFGGIPLATFYTTRTEFMVAEPPLEDLAWMNLAHWQSLSDQRNILRFARVGILFGSGLNEEEVEQGITIGASQMISSTNPDAKLQYVEHSGRAIGAGEDDLKRLEERMEVLGLQPLVQATGNATATGRAMDEARTHSNIQAWIRGLENTLHQAFEIAGQWVNQQVSDDFAIDIFNDFGVSLSATDDIKALIAMKEKGMISHETFLDEVKRRGVLSDNVDALNEIDAIGEDAVADIQALQLQVPIEEDDDDDKEGE